MLFTVGEKNEKIIKNRQKLSKIKIVKKNKCFLLFLCHNEATCQNCVCRSDGVASGQHKDKEEKIRKKT